MSAPVTTAISPQRTHPSNATAHPGAIILGAKVKRQTKSQVQVDNKRVEEEEKTRKRAEMEGVERLAAIEMDMEEKATELASKKMKPVWPARKGKVAEDACVLASKTAGDINVDSQPDESTKKPTDGIQLSKISLKDVVTHAKAEMMHGQRKEKNVPISVKSTRVVPDGKTSHKRKAKEVDPVSDSEPEMFRAADDRRSSRGASEVTSADSADMDDAVLAEKSSMKKEHETSVGITRSSIPLSKKVKLEVAGDLDNKVSVSQGPHKTKPRSKYSNSDLPIPVDYRWTNCFLDTATLWAGSQPNIWTIPEDAMVTTFQAIFNAVYPDVVYTVKNHSSQAVFTVASQCLAEWRSGFGSTALAMVIDLFSKIDEQPHDEVSDALDIPALHTQELLEGYQMDGVIALATAALEHAFSFVRDDIINVKSIIEHMETNGGKLEIRLPKTLNKATGRETSGPYMFSVSNWGEETASYKISIASRGDENTIDVIASAQTLLKKSTAPRASVGTPADVDRCVLL
ncbi:hypothetical protein BKA83DRAFT_4497153 [Pisolithus microcarpus]|nr:hypothetical protein BKA83DRAFT_4497153 [Pisolithus microcarpus]